MSDPRLLSEELLVDQIRNGQVSPVMTHIDALTERCERLEAIATAARPILERDAEQGSGHVVDEDGCHLQSAYVHGLKVAVGSPAYWASIDVIEWRFDPCPACEESQALLVEIAALEARDE